MDNSIGDLETSMIFKTITYERVKNLGNYENVRIGVTAEVEDDDPGSVLKEIKKFVSVKLEKES